MMGLWFASQALANAIGGALAGEYAAMSHAQFFWAPVYLSGISALALWVLVRPLRRLVQPQR
jgi:dipeptide/tripeptide permease